MERVGQFLGSVINGASKILTGKTVNQHAANAARSAADKLGSAIKKSPIVKNTIGRSRANNTYRNMERTQQEYERSIQNRSQNPSAAQKALYSAQDKLHKKNMNQQAMKTAQIQRNYGL